ncbi:integrator complex subunit 4 [Pholidichthys leucotaenia]
MAAHLKKRVYEEFSKVVQVPPEDTPSKKVRLSKPSKSASLHLDLCKASTPTDALQLLLHFSHRPVEADSVEGVVRILLEHYYKESDNSVRLKISSLIGLLSKTRGFRPDCIVDDVISTLTNEKSHQVLAQLLDSLLLIGSHLPKSPAVRGTLVDVAWKHLSDTYFGVRVKCLQLLGCLGVVDAPLNKDDAPSSSSSSSSGLRDIQSIISDYFGDQDPRVRTAALKAMLQLHERGIRVHQIIYEQACRLLSDDYEQVRSAAVQMVWVLSQLYPESIVPIPSSSEEIRLVDDAFGKISHMVSDGSWMVRVQAAKTLGSMLQVSPHFLEQTLDKKLMSDLRRKRTAHERAKELFVSGEFSSGRKWADDAPKEKLDTNTVNLIASGACGAFVHGLEDEMFEVRIAAVEALCHLAKSSPNFAEKCLDFLVDMFNDEIEEVRLRSIHVLRQISTHITLREDQLDTVLAVLEDSSRDIREALHELLCFTNVSTKECIQLALLELLKNLNKYPSDRSSVWKCLKFLGSRHPTLVLPLVPELLSTHPYFDTPEPDMDDPAYMAVLVLVFNAAQSCPTMASLFSDHTYRHYAYLRDSLSHLVPPLRLPGRKQVCGLDSVDSGSGSGSVESAQVFLQQSLDRVSTIQNLETPGAQDLLDFTIRDLERLGELQPELAGSADFCATYLRCQLLLIKALQDKLWNTAVPLCLKQNVTATAAAHQILEQSYKLEFLYGGLESSQVAVIHHVRLQAKALLLLLGCRYGNGLDHLISSCDKFLQEVDTFQRCFVSETSVLQDSFVDRLVQLKPRVSSSKPSELVKIVQRTLRQSGPLQLRLPDQVQRARADIIEPTGQSENPLRFTSGLVVALDIDATLENIQDPQDTIKVQVLYPDGQSHVIHPKPADFRNPGPGRHRLITQVFLSHTAWTEPSQIEVRLLLAYSTSSSCGDGLPPAEGAVEGTLPLSKPVKVFIMPKPARR